MYDTSNFKLDFHLSKYVLPCKIITKPVKFIESLKISSVLGEGIDAEAIVLHLHREKLP